MAAANFLSSNSMVPVWVMLMPISDGERGRCATGREAAESMLWFTARTVLSPAKMPAVTLVPPVSSRR